MAEESPSDLEQVLLTGAQTLVNAMASDGWAMFKQRFATVAGGHEKRLEATHRQLTAAEPSDLERVRADEVRSWNGRLRDSVDDEPDRLGELRRVIAEVAPQVQTTTVSGSGQINVASDGSSIYHVTAGRDSHIIDKRKTFKIFGVPLNSVGHLFTWIKTMAFAHPVVAMATVVAVAAGAAGVTVAANSDSGLPSGQVTVGDCQGVDLYTSPLRAVPVCTDRTATQLGADLVFHFNNLYSPGPVPVLARWKSTHTPSAADCQKTIDPAPQLNLAPVYPGDEFCLATHTGGYAFLRIVAASPVQLTIAAQILS